MKRTFRLLFFLLFCLLLVSSASADVLRLPAGLKVIEEEAFFGDRNIDEVVLPEGIEVIGERAFAESGLTKINLPSSLKKIEDNALDEGVTFTAEEGTYTVHVQKVPEGYAACKDEFEVPQDFGDVKIILNKA